MNHGCLISFADVPTPSMASNASFVCGKALNTASPLNNTAHRPMASQI